MQTLDPIASSGQVRAAPVCPVLPSLFPLCRQEPTQRRDGGRAPGRAQGAALGAARKPGNQSCHLMRLLFQHEHHFPEGVLISTWKKKNHEGFVFKTQFVLCPQGPCQGPIQPGLQHRPGRGIHSSCGQPVPAPQRPAPAGARWLRCGFVLPPHIPAPLSHAGPGGQTAAALGGWRWW